jgi:hypothetical protein
MIFGNSNNESQQDSGLKPRVARNALPWVVVVVDFNPNGVALAFLYRGATPLGLWSCDRFSQGSSFLATLGWMTQSLWDCGSRPVNCAAAQSFTQLAFPNGIQSNIAFKAKP